METVFKVTSRNVPKLYDYMNGQVRVLPYERRSVPGTDLEEFIFLLEPGIYILRHNRKVKYLRVQPGEVEEFPWFLLRGPHTEPAR